MQLPVNWGLLLRVGAGAAIMYLAGVILPSYVIVVAVAALLFFFLLLRNNLQYTAHAAVGALSMYLLPLIGVSGLVALALAVVIGYVLTLVLTALSHTVAPGH